MNYYYYIVIVTCVCVCLEVQTKPRVCDAGVQCGLFVPSIPLTSAPRKSSIYEVDISYTDINDTIDATESTGYTASEDFDSKEDNSCAESAEVDKETTYLVFETAILLLFSISFACTGKAVTITKTVKVFFLRITQTCKACTNTFIWPFIRKFQLVTY